MSIKVTRGLVAEWFRPDSQKDATTPAEFMLRPLSQIELLDVQGVAASDLNGQAADLALRRAMRDWRGVFDGETELRFDPGLIPSLPAGLLIELVRHVLAVSKLSEDERKNS